MAFVLEIAEKIGEDLRIGREAVAVLLQLSFGLVVVQATICPDPCVGRLLVTG